MTHNAMIFAAGLGTRMGALTKNRPKPLIEVAGKPLLDHALALCDANSVGSVVVNVHYHADQIRDHLSGRDVLISDETPALLETGGGLRKALPLLGPDPVFTLNSDMVWRGENPLTQLAAAWQPRKMDALLLVLPTTHATGHSGKGDFAIGGDGQLRRGGDYVYLGAQLLKTETLHSFEEEAFSLNQLWDQFSANNRLFGLVYTGDWCDVGTPDGIAVAEAMLSGGSDV